GVERSGGGGVGLPRLFTHSYGAYSCGKTGPKPIGAAGPGWWKVSSGSAIGATMRLHMRAVSMIDLASGSGSIACSWTSRRSCQVRILCKRYDAVSTRQPHRWLL